MKRLNVERKLSKEEIKKIVESKKRTKSEKMKELFIGGLEVKEISILMNVRYNFVYNVVSNYVRMNDLEEKVISEKKINRKDDIVKLMKEGKSNIEISKILKCNYNYVWKICNEELKKVRK
jgi:DNA-binding NarL/FixJ family response regulator